jgi:biopolymer transport protein ExbD
MKFPRNAKMLRGQMDVAPFAGVFFCLVIFVLLASLVYTPGVHIELPAAVEGMTGVDGPTFAVALDANGLLYFDNQKIEKQELQRRLEAEVKKSTQPLTLVVLADKAVSMADWDSLMDMAKKVGVQHVLDQRLPRVFGSTTGAKSQ